jgi:hypothetical protein
MQHTVWWVNNFNLSEILNAYRKLTIFVYMARDVIISMGENPFRGPLEGVGPENRDFFGP